MAVSTDIGPVHGGLQDKGCITHNKRTSTQYDHSIAKHIFANFN